MALTQLRTQIDSIDKKIVELVARRLRLMKTVAREKQRLGLPTRDVAREEAMIKVRAAWLKKAGFDDVAFTRWLFRLIVQRSRKEQQRIRSRKLD